MLWNLPIVVLGCDVCYGSRQDGLVKVLEALQVC
jgi:hypothetical protein